MDFFVYSKLPRGEISNGFEYTKLYNHRLYETILFNEIGINFVEKYCFEYKYSYRKKMHGRPSSVRVNKSRNSRCAKLFSNSNLCINRNRNNNYNNNTNNFSIWSEIR